MQENNLFSGVNLSLFKTGPDIWKIKSANVPFHANPNTSPNAQREQICIYIQIFRRFRGLLNHSAAVAFLKTVGFSLRIDNTQAAKMCLIDL